MDYKYDNGLELLLAHMNLEDIINAAETLYQLEEDGEEGGLSLEEESLSQEEMDENEETGLGESAEGL
ncbi:Lysophosphatidylcholine acyltransferase 2 [Dissostichus eleginoides]|uniref:Lysophosphatidylcholine acyltransferase 2 n=1 Tax=Dissostichus eleginoides TaxID=100907 RepID=A0AAD9BL81_DISEL|nr:Lysophosphatidylcholine acyltransferase 2 [Dissostichus eleginoides]